MMALIPWWLWLLVACIFSMFVFWLIEGRKVALAEKRAAEADYRAAVQQAGYSDSVIKQKIAQDDAQESLIAKQKAQDESIALAKSKGVLPDDI